MGIFDKKSSKRNTEDFDSPVERVDLSAPTPVPEEIKAEAAEVAEEEPAATPQQDYGIEQAIALMRTLPSDSVELVVRVVKHTLESTDIDIPTIIADAAAKQARIDTRVALLREEITDLESEIAKRTEEISNLEEDHRETSMVKERLELAEKLGSKDSGSKDSGSKSSGSKSSGPSSKSSSKPDKKPESASSSASK